VENAVGILEKGIFHDMEEREYFSLEQFNDDLWSRLERLNNAPFTKKEHCRSYYWEAEREDLMELPLTPYEYMERKVAKVARGLYVLYGGILSFSRVTFNPPLHLTLTFMPWTAAIRKNCILPTKKISPEDL